MAERQEAARRRIRRKFLVPLGMAVSGALPVICGGIPERRDVGFFFLFS